MHVTWSWLACPLHKPRLQPDSSGWLLCVSHVPELFSLRFLLWASRQNTKTMTKKKHQLWFSWTQKWSMFFFFPHSKKAAVLVCKYAAFFFSFLVSQLQSQFYQYDLETQCCCRLLFISVPQRWFLSFFFFCNPQKAALSNLTCPLFNAGHSQA